MDYSGPHPASAVTPSSEYRTNKLPEEVRDWISTQSKRLNEAFEAEEFNYKSKKKEILGKAEWDWFAEGSERTIACLGRTHNGEGIYPTLEAVVIKFNPLLRPSAYSQESTVNTIRNPGNIHELAVWKWACDYDDTDLFGTILDFSKWGDWIAQKYYIPIYLYKTPNHSTRVDYLSDQANSRDESYENVVKKQMRDRGYNPHVKDGNIGLDPQQQTAVCIDFGAHFDIGGVDDDRLLNYVLKE